MLNNHIATATIMRQRQEWSENVYEIYFLNFIWSLPEVGFVVAGEKLIGVTSAKNFPPSPSFFWLEPPPYSSTPIGGGWLLLPFVVFADEGTKVEWRLSRRLACVDCCPLPPSRIRWWSEETGVVVDSWVVVVEREETPLELVVPARARCTCTYIGTQKNNRGYKG